MIAAEASRVARGLHARRPRRLLFVVSEDWYFCSHRLPIALAALRRGYEVAVATRVSEHGEKLRQTGLQVIPLSMSRSGTHPLRELRTIMTLWRLYRRLRPDIVHHVALKPVVLGSLAARLANVPTVVNAVAGFGYLSAASDLEARLLRPVLRVLLRAVLGARGTTVVVQHAHDARALIEAGVDEAAVEVIRGAGVDLAAVRPTPEPAGVPLVMLAARMLWDKGVGDFVEAARRLRGRGLDARFVLVGRPDSGNPRSVSSRQLEAWQTEGSVEWWGYSNDMAATLAQCNVFCLPTFYGEGIPKVLLEAAAAGRAIVASDIAGCREVVQDGVSGILVPPQRADLLADAIERLVAQPVLRTRLAQAARHGVEAQFSVDAVVDATMAIYERSRHAEGRA